MTDLEIILSNLEDVIKVQCYPGNYDSSPYMLGLANGLLLAKSIFTGKEAEYMKPPEMYLEDLPREDFTPCIESKNYE